jgi:hypothetical protein
MPPVVGLPSTTVGSATMSMSPISVRADAQRKSSPVSSGPVPVDRPVGRVDSVVVSRTDQRAPRPSSSAAPTERRRREQALDDRFARTESGVLAPVSDARAVPMRSKDRLLAAPASCTSATTTSNATRTRPRPADLARRWASTSAPRGRPCASPALPVDDSGSHLDGGPTNPRHTPAKLRSGSQLVQASVSTVRRICSISSKCSSAARNARPAPLRSFYVGRRRRSETASLGCADTRHALIDQSVTLPPASISGARARAGSMSPATGCRRAAGVASARSRDRFWRAGLRPRNRSVSGSSAECGAAPAAASASQTSSQPLQASTATSIS